MALIASVASVASVASAAWGNLSNLPRILSPGTDGVGASRQYSFFPVSYANVFPPCALDRVPFYAEENKAELSTTRHGLGIMHHSLNTEWFRFVTPD